MPELDVPGCRYSARRFAGSIDAGRLAGDEPAQSRARAQGLGNRAAWRDYGSAGPRVANSLSADQHVVALGCGLVLQHCQKWLQIRARPTFEHGVLPGV